MNKKILALASVGALLLGVALPVFAHHRSRGSADVAIVDNSATAVADTGTNGQGNTALINGGVDDTNVSGNNSMSTGNASAYAGALVVANTHVDCGSCASGGRRHTDFADVDNDATAKAYTGYNGQGNIADIDGGHGHHGAGVDDTNVSGDNSMSTGGASSTARAWTIVNTHVSF